MLTNQVGNPMGQRPGLAAPRSSNHQKRAFMVINRPLLGVIQTGEKTHPLMVCEQSDELGADATHQGIAKRFPDNTCCMTAFSKMNSSKATPSNKLRTKLSASD